MTPSCATSARQHVALVATAGLLAGLTAAALPAAPAHAQETRTAAAAAVPVGAAKIGVSRIENGARVFYLASAYVDGGGTVTRVAFGDAGDIPTFRPGIGGGCEPGVYRPSNATFYQAEDPVFGIGTVTSTAFGDSGDRPVQNARHRDAQARGVLKLQRPSTATIYTRTEDDEGAANQVSVTADAFGDGSDLAFQVGVNDGPFGVYRPSNSTFYVQSSGSVTVQQFGNVGDQGLVGAWTTSIPDTQQPDSVGVFRAAEGRWYLGQRDIVDDGTQQAPQTDVYSFSFGSPGDTALACDGD